MTALEKISSTAERGWAGLRSYDWDIWSRKIARIG